MKKNKVFLGGTCAGTNWRENIIPLLEERQIKYFNPVVEDWTPDCQVIEELEKLNSNIHLYLITPEMIGVYSIAEIIDSIYRYRGVEGQYCVIGFLGNQEAWGKAQWKSLDATLNLIKRISKNNIASGWLNKDTDIVNLIDEVLKDGGRV